VKQWEERGGPAETGPKTRQGEKAKGADLSGKWRSQRLSFAMRAVSLSDQGSNLDFLESKSSVLPVTPSDNFPAGYVPFGSANVRLEIFSASFWRKKSEEKMRGTWAESRSRLIGA
jgi:hypothetical protein